jgi:hypothetical protein
MRTGIDVNFGKNPEPVPAERMSLRDHFAGQAPVDWGMAQQAAGLDATVSPAERLKLWGAMAILRYEFADAMLAERVKGGA